MMLDFLVEDDAKRGRGGKAEVLARADEAPLDYIRDSESVDGRQSLTTI
jgi:hypothetical protein